MDYSSLWLWRGRLIVSLSPNLLIEIRRGSTGNRDRRPVIASENPCDQHDLADMVRLRNLCRLGFGSIDLRSAFLNRFSDSPSLPVLQ